MNNYLSLNMDMLLAIINFKVLNNILYYDDFNR